MKTVSHFERLLNRDNIDQTISDYQNLLSEIPLSFSAQNILELLGKLKRERVGFGPYPDVSIFESSNRIMTDLVILYGVKSLLQGAVPQLKFTNYEVEFGTENRNEHDILASEGSVKLRGEAFNVAQSFFQNKKNKSLKKLRESSGPEDFLLLMYNADAVNKDYRPKIVGHEIHLPVQVKI